MDKVYSYEICAILISLIILIYFGRNKKVNTFQNKVFLSLIVINMIAAIADSSRSLFFWFHQSAQFHNVVRMIFFIAHVATVPVLFIYVFSFLRNWYETNIRVKLVILIPGIIGELLVLINPFIHFVYGFDSEGNYVRGTGLGVIYFIVAYYYLLCVYISIKYRAKLSVSKRLCIITMMSFILAGVIIQIVNVSFRMETFSIAFGLLILFFFVQNPHDQIDSETNLFSRHAFEEMMKQYFLVGRKFSVIELVLSDFDEASHHETETNKAVIASMIGEFLSEITGVKAVYRVEKNVFVAEFSNLEADALSLRAKDIGDRFRLPWTVSEMDHIYSIRICSLSVPEEVGSYDEFNGIIYATDSLKTDKTMLGVKDYDTKALERKRLINSALKKSVQSDNFSLVFTPVFDLNRKRISGMEMSVRTSDPSCGYIYEDDIREYVEKSGQFMKMGCELFAKTLKYMSDDRFKIRDIDYVFIRLSSLACIQMGIMKEILKQIDECDVDASKIVLMISEYTVSKAFDDIKDDMQLLRDKKINFCLEEYGSGYTNIESMYMLPFNLIKISSNIIRDSIENEKAHISLRSTIQMAAELGMKSIISGIAEYKEFNLIKGMNPDYAEGAFFLEKLEEDKFLEAVDDSVKGGKS